MNTLAERLKFSREKLDLTQQEVANRAGMSQPTYYKIESGKSQRTTYLNELANVLKVNPNWLATGQGEMTESTQSAPVSAPKQIRMWDFTPSGVSVRRPENSPIIDAKNVIYCQVLDESMSPFFYKGDYVFADRSLKPETGGYVIAKKSDGSEIVRRYKEYLDPKTGELHQELIALDEFFPAIQKANESFEILGTIFEHKRFISKGVSPLETIGLR